MNSSCIRIDGWREEFRFGLAGKILKPVKTKIGLTLLRAQSFTYLMGISVKTQTEFLHLAGALLRHWYKNPNDSEKSNKYKSSLLS